MSKLKELVRDITPPILLRWRQQISRRTQLQEWEYIAQGWSYLAEHPEVKGWNVAEVLTTYQQKWPAFVDKVAGTNPLGITHESDLLSNEDLVSHNGIMTFGYILALSALQKRQISILDWGGGIGHYCLLAKALLQNQDRQLDYHCKDVPLLVEYGLKLFPDQHFYVDDSCLHQSYDLVMASTSLHYTENWQELVRNLASATKNYLYLANVPTVKQADSFVFVQRAYKYGYNTEYLGWCLNHHELIAHAEKSGLILRREFVYGHKPTIHNAPEQNEYRGYLFSTEK